MTPLRHFMFVNVVVQKGKILGVFNSICHGIKNFPMKTSTLLIYVKNVAKSVEIIVFYVHMFDLFIVPEFLNARKIYAVNHSKVKKDSNNIY